MSTIYSEIIWLGAIVLVLTSAAVIGLWNRPDPSALEPVKPLLLSPEERELLLQDKMSTFQKAARARKEAKRAGRINRRQMLMKQQAAVKKEPTS